MGELIVIALGIACIYWQAPEPTLESWFTTALFDFGCFLLICVAAAPFAVAHDCWKHRNDAPAPPVKTSGFAGYIAMPDDPRWQ